MVVDTELNFSAVAFLITSEQLFVGYVNADDCLRVKALHLNSLKQKSKILWEVCCDHPRVFSELLQRKTERVAAAERVAVGVGVGKDFKVVVLTQKFGYQIKLHLYRPRFR